MRHEDASALLGADRDTTAAADAAAAAAVRKARWTALIIAAFFSGYEERDRVPKMGTLRLNG